MKIVTRRLREHEALLYREIRLEALRNNRDAFTSTYEEESVKPKLSGELSIESQSKTNFVIGAFDGERLVGICGFYQEPQKKTRHKGWIVGMYVKAEYQRKGIGLQLLQTAIDEAFKNPEVEQLQLGVMGSNMAASRTYEKAGFVEYGFHKGYAKDGDKYIDERMMIL